MTTKSPKKNKLPTAKAEYHYVPAAYSQSNMYGIGVYVKYRRGPHGVTKLYQDSGTVIVSTPDRELTIVRHQREAPLYPANGDYHEFVNLNLYNDHAASDLGFTWFMNNYSDYIGKEDKGARSRVVRDPTPDAPARTIKIISDSGGFQLYSKKLDFINPYKMGEWYSANSDVGIVLDIPLASVIKNEKYLKRFAKLQKKNTDIILQTAGPGLELMNVMHGVGFEEKLKYHEIVHDPKITRLAVGGNYMDTLFSGVSKFLALVGEIGKHYTHYHMLGITNPLQIMMYMRLAHVGLVPYITSDSSTYYQKATSKEYLSQTRLLANISHLNIGAKDNLASEHAVLSCACPVCSRVRYTDVLSQFSGSPISALIASHNAWRFNEYLRTMTEVMQQPLPEVFKILKHQMGKRAGLKEVTDTLQFIDMVAESGLVKARKKFAYYSNDLASAFHSSDGLFAIEEGMTQVGETVEVSHLLERADFLLSKYEKFDPTTKGEEHKDETKGRKTKIHSSKARKREKLKKSKKSN